MIVFGSKASGSATWPAQSPDINPIENVWAIVKRVLRKLDKYPTTSDALFNSPCEIWNGLPSSFFTTLVDSMVTRCNTLKNVRGDATRY